MADFLTIYRFELKKIVCKKLFVIMATLLLLLVIFTPFSNLVGQYYEEGTAIESNYDYYLNEQSAKKALSGRRIDEALMEEAIEAYKKVPDVYRYSQTKEYRDNAIGYHEIFSFLRQSTGLNAEELKNWKPDEGALYKARIETLSAGWADSKLTESEIEFWKDWYEKTKKPYTYYYHDGYGMLINAYATVSTVTLVFLAIVLAGLFPGERAMKTDQLILSSARGKNVTFLAKMLAGITVSLCTTLLLSGLLYAACLGFYGADGGDIQLSFDIFFSTYPLTISKGCLIAYGMLQVGALLWSVFVMTISEFLKNGMASLSVSMVIIIGSGMISIPSYMRVLSQIWDWMPTKYLAVWNIFDERMLPVFGKCFTSWQAVPMIYLCLAVVVFLIGKRKYVSTDKE